MLITVSAFILLRGVPGGLRHSDFGLHIYILKSKTKFQNEKFMVKNLHVCKKRFTFVNDLQNTPQIGLNR